MPAATPAITPVQFLLALRTERIMLMHQQMVAEKEADSCLRRLTVIDAQIRIIEAAQAEGQHSVETAARICPVFKGITGGAS